MSRTLLLDCYPDDYKNRLPNYRRLLDAHGEVEVLDSRNLAEDMPTAGYNAVVFTGSPMMLTKTAPPDNLVGFARRLALPVLGICFGHQLLGIATGVDVDRREFYEGPGTVRVTEPGELFRGMGPELEVFESHAEFLVRESVEQAGWEVLADSEHCPVEAMRHREKPLHCVQFHPELSGEVGEQVVANFYRYVVARWRERS